jgi:hypothetical protein
MRTVYVNGKELRYETEDQLALLMQDEIICAALHRYTDAAEKSAGTRRDRRNQNSLRAEHH